MKIAIMQPYIFPYLGYFQLINAVDKFIIYDDVNFIKQGWINRNYFLLNGSKYLFTIPVENISSYTKINELKLSVKPFGWQKKILQTVAQAYRKAPFFNDVFPIIEKVINCSHANAGCIALESILSVNEYLSINTDLVKSSEIYQNSDIKNVDRVIDICKRENATIYINAIGGQELYSAQFFLQNKIRLRFLKPCLCQYKQFENEFIMGLSMIDVLMFNSPVNISAMLNQYELI